MSVLKLNGFVGNDLSAYSIEPKYSILVLNIMPNKLETEQQISQLLSELPFSVAVTFMYPETHFWKHGDQDELAYHYATLKTIADKYFDGFLVTGAPLEKLKFTDVDFWEEFQLIRDWSLTHTKYQLFTCWGAQAALYDDYQIPKVNVQRKIFGVYGNQVNTDKRWENFWMPQSRYSKVDNHSIVKNDAIKVLADNVATGPFVMKSAERHSLYVLGHPEYQAQTLVNEYFRDQKRGLDTDKPANLSLKHPDGSYVRWHNSSLRLYRDWFSLIEEESIKNDKRQLQI